MSLLILVSRPSLSIASAWWGFLRKAASHRDGAGEGGGQLAVGKVAAIALLVHKIRARGGGHECLWWSRLGEFFIFFNSDV